MYSYNKKNIIMIVMIVGIMLMTIGYALLSTSLNIKGISNLTGSWNIKITNVTSVATGKAYNITNPVYDETTMTFNVGVKVPGDKMTFSVTVTNAGDIDAYLDNIDASMTGSDVITYNISGIQNKEILARGQSKTFTVTTEFDINATEIPSDPVKDLTITLNYLQYDGQTLTPSDPNIEYIAPPYLVTQILHNNNGGTSDDGLDIDSTAGEGLYYTNTRTENNQTTYYFRNSDNNYIKFGKNHCIFTGEYDESSGLGWDMNVKLFYNDMVYWTIESYEDCMQDVYTHPFDPNFHAGFSSVDECTAYWRQVMVEQAGVTPTDSDVCQVHKNATAWTSDLLWRIIRINEDGSVRIMLDNVDDLEGFKSTFLPYNSPFPGFHWSMYDYHNNHLGSTLYDWYEYKELNQLSNSVVDSGFCINVDGETTTMTIEGYDENTPNILTMVNHIRENPSFACPNSDDYLHTTSSSNKGNKLLEYPIGLITYDEVRYIKSSISNANGLTLTPYYSTSDTEGQNLYGYWYLTDYTIDYQIPSYYYAGNTREGYAIPVINIKGDLEVAYYGTGTPGSSTNPYVVLHNNN